MCRTQARRPGAASPTPTAMRPGLATARPRIALPSRPRRQLARLTLALQRCTPFADLVHTRSAELLLRCDDVSYAGPEAGAHASRDTHGHATGSRYRSTTDRAPKPTKASACEADPRAPA